MKVYRRILGPVYDNKKENWRILTNKDMQFLKKTYHNRDSKVTQVTLVCKCTENGRKYNSQQNIVCEFGNKTNGRPRNRLQDDVRED
jgi:hypothetical protein